MIPSSTLGLVVFLAAVAPGYVFLRLVERRIVRHERSAWLQAVDLLCIGAACTLVGATLLLLLAELVPEVLVDLRTLVGMPADLVARPWRPLVSGLAVVVVSSALAAGLAVLTIRMAGSRSSLRAGNAWSATFGRFQRPTSSNEPARSLYLVVQLTDGRNIGGQLIYGDLEAEPGKREIALTGPIWMTEAGGTERHPMPYDFVLLKNADIALMMGRVLGAVGSPRQQ